ncbi:hypothetical protein [Stenotrophomonas rhizophila]|uniref:hypothetical protein n=1 Tax=Stenotrophomonas rhizophila TaxID=216778 RepID=UPI001E376999|nr:hypothetical protein [Stenotrophomonas rhizophila]MCC7635429.1 hypothetical protein [Stenotrophomonas rhizophila]MCC7664627.1 hypothetical protein [Stenotrophomonas rhizophila]
MNKGIPYLLAALSTLTVSAGWMAPVLALFHRAYACLEAGGGLDLLRLRCEPRPTGLCALLAAWPFWMTAAATALVVVLAVRLPLRRRRVSVA